MSYEIPPGAVIKYKTHRHWYELVAEISDAVWWCAIITSFSIGMAYAVERRFIWLLVCCVYPAAHLGAEVARWLSETYYIVDVGGSTMIAKEWGVFNQKDIDDFTKGMTPMQQSTLFGRFVGFVEAHLVFDNRTYIDGTRVPVQLMKEITKTRTKREARTVESERELILASIAEWVHTGLLDPYEAKAAISRAVEENL